MSEFTPITTQEDLDRVIKDRVERAKESARKEFADYEQLKKDNAGYSAQIADLQKQLESSKAYPQQIADLQKQLAKRETDSAKIMAAVKHSIPMDMADRISGTTAEEIEADAAKIAAYFKNPAMPLRSPEPSGEPNTSTSALKELLGNLKGE